MRRFHFVLIFGLISGCASKNTVKDPGPGTARSEASAAAVSAKPVSNRPSNHAGEVLIIEYHKIAKSEARWDRSEARFRGDLERLYNMGFRPVTLQEYVSDKLAIAPGASPVVITFDDATPSQIKLLPDGSVDPECAAGIWQDFAKKHPDFPIKATFFVLPDTMWGQAKLIDRKIEMLKGWGCVIGSHTVTHPKLSHLNDEQVKGELGGAIDYLASKGIQQPVLLALPYGISPKNKGLLHGFEWKGKKYEMNGAVLVGANPAPPPGKEDPYRIPRIQGIEGVNGITFWLDAIEKGRVKVYVE